MAKRPENIELALEQLAQKFPEMQRDFCASAGRKLAEKVKRNIAERTKRKTGSLLKAVTLKLGSGGGYAAVRNDFSVAPHAALVEYGHQIKGKDGKVKGWSNGRKMYRDALADLENELLEDAKQLAEEVVRLVE